MGKKSKMNNIKFRLDIFAGVVCDIFVEDQRTIRWGHVAKGVRRFPVK